MWKFNRLDLHQRSWLKTTSSGNFTTPGRVALSSRHPPSHTAPSKADLVVLTFGSWKWEGTWYEWELVTCMSHFQNHKVTLSAKQVQDSSPSSRHMPSRCQEGIWCGCDGNLIGKVLEERISQWENFSRGKCNRHGMDENIRLEKFQPGEIE